MVHPTEEVEDLDRLFDILLVLLGIVTATLFQFVSAIVPQQIAAQNPGLSQDQLSFEVTKEITRWLRVFFIPLVLLIGIWFFNRIALMQRPNVKRALSEFCYVMGFTILAHDIVYFSGAVTMQPLIEMTSSNISGGLYSALMTAIVFLASLGLVHRYETLAGPPEKEGVSGTTKGFWRNVLVRTIAFWLITLGIVNWIEMLSVYEFI